MAASNYENYREMMGLRYGDDIRLSAEYAGQFLANSLGVIHKVSGRWPDADQLGKWVAGVMTSPEVVAAVVTAQAQIFTALAAAHDAASDEQMLTSSLGDIAAAVRSLDRS